MNETSIPRQRPVLKPTIILSENNMNANIKAKIYALHNTLLSFSIQENDKANGAVNTNYPRLIWQRTIRGPVLQVKCSSSNERISKVIFRFSRVHKTGRSDIRFGSHSLPFSDNWYP
ncbi:MAG: hypothetical protein WBL44_06625 [Nitrososphaeraceae archaeon]